MNLVPYSYAGTAIKDGTGYTNASLLLRDAYRGARAVWSERAWTDPKLAGKTYPGANLKLLLSLGTTSADACSRLFDKYDQTPRTFICKDSENSDKQWYVKAYATEIAWNAKNAEISLAVDEPQEWQSNTLNAGTWSVTATGGTYNFSPAISGNRPCKPAFAITPTSARGTASTGYLYMMHVPIYGTQTAHAPAYPVNIVQAGTVNVWNHAAEVTALRSLATGNDIRVMVDNQEVDYWLSGANGTVAKIWINLDFEPGQTMTLGTALGTTTVTSFTVAATAANKTAMKALPAQGVYDADVMASENCILLIDSEIFIAQAVNPLTYTFSGVTRAANDTTAGTHSAGASIRWIQHDVKILYGDLTASAPTIDDTRKPIIDLANSTNASWVYTTFASTDNKRTGGWKPSITAHLGAETVYYTGSHGANADPATEMGMSIKAFKYGGKWCAENATIQWTHYNPFGFTTVTSSGDKYRVSTDWASGWGVGLRHYNLTAPYYETNFEATPATAGSWTAFTHSTTSLAGTFTNLKAVLAGPITGSASNANHLEYQGITISGIQNPTVNCSARKDAYHLDVTLSNETSGESIAFNLPMTINTALTIDCDKMIAKYADGRILPLTLSTKRHNWLDCGPAATTLKWTAPGTAGVTVVITWRDRNL